MLRIASLVICAVIIGGYFVSESNALTGYIEDYYVRTSYTRNTSCCLFGWGRRTVISYRSSLRQRCQAYWKDDGNGHCNIPVCTTPCDNGGTCVSPNTCS